MKKEGGRTSMNFHKTLKKIKSNMLSIFLAIAVSLTTLPYTTAPLLIHADNAGGGGSGGGTEYSRAVTPPIRQTGNRLSGRAGTA